MGLDGDAEFFGEGGEGLLSVVFVGVEKVNFGDFLLLDPTGEHLGVAGFPGAVGESAVQNAVAGLLQGGGMVTHGRVKEGEFLLMVAEMTRPRGGFNHSDKSVFRGRGQEGVIRQKLIAENPDQAHRPSLKQPPVFGSKNGLFR